MPTFEEYVALREGKPQSPSYDLKALKEDLDPPDDIAAGLPFGKELVKDLDEEGISWLAKVFEVEDIRRYGTWNAKYHGLNLDSILNNQIERGENRADHLKRFAQKKNVPIAPISLMLAQEHDAIGSAGFAVEVREELKQQVKILDPVNAVTKKADRKKDRLYDALSRIREFMSDGQFGSFGEGFLLKETREARTYKRLIDEYDENFLRQVFEFVCRFERIVEEEVKEDREELQQNIDGRENGGYSPRRWVLRAVLCECIEKPRHHAGAR